MSTKILPCPFCGSRGEIFVGGFGERLVSCTNEQCQAQLGGGIWFTDDEAAIAKWNERDTGKESRYAYQGA